jgi:hypothetical protein
VSISADFLIDNGHVEPETCQQNGFEINVLQNTVYPTTGLCEDGLNSEYLPEDTGYIKGPTMGQVVSSRLLIAEV